MQKNERQKAAFTQQKDIVDKSSDAFAQLHAVYFNAPIPISDGNAVSEGALMIFD